MWLTVTPPLHVALWGVWVTTPDVSPDQAIVRVATTVENSGSADAAGEVRVTVLSQTGKPVTTGEAAAFEVAPGTATVVTQHLTVKRPKLWSVDEPSLYTAHVEVLSGGKTLDCTETTFGIRTFSFNARSGFILNGRTMKLKGGCMHHDNGPLGAATIDRAEVRRVEIHEGQRL